MLGKPMRAALLCSALMLLPAMAQAGIVIVKAKADTSLGRAGVQTGDRVDSFEQTHGDSALHGTISNPFELELLQAENLAWGPVVLHGVHAGAAAKWTMHQHSNTGWNVQAQLPLDAATTQALDSLLDVLARSELDKLQHAHLLAIIEQVGRHHADAWPAVVARDASFKADAGKHRELAAELRALSLTRAAGSAKVRAMLRVDYAKGAANRGDWDAAFEHLHTSLGELAAEGQDHSVMAAYTRYLLGAMDARRGKPDALGELMRAEALYAKVAPDSWNRAINAIELGSLTNTLRDRDASAGHYENAIAVFRRGDPEGFWVLNPITSLAIVEGLRGNTARARKLLEDATPLLATMPDDALKPAVLRNFAENEIDRGDYAAAERHLRLAVDIAERFPRADHLPSAAIANLAEVLQVRGDFAGALHYSQLRLQAIETYAKDSPAAATALLTLADLEREQGDLEQATAHAQRALDIQRKISQGKPYSISPLLALAAAELDRSRPDAAAPLLSEARATIATHPEDEGSQGALLRQEGRLQLARGESSAAAKSLRQALQITLARSPGSLMEAESHDYLGQALQAAKEPDAARDEFCAGADALERQIGRLGGGGEARASFFGSTRRITLDCVQARIDTGQIAQAFFAAERGRSRGLLRLIAERKLDFADDASAPLLAERKRLDADYDETAAQLAALPANDEKAAALATDMDKLRERRAELGRRLRENSPHLAAVVDPQPKDAAASARALDPGSVLVSYLIGPQRSWLFVLPAGEGQGLRVLPLAIGEHALRERVQRWRGLIAAHAAKDLPALQQEARALYTLLLQPAEKELVHAERILIAADGPLALLPFAALRRDEAGYLIDWKPLAQVASASVLAENRAERTAKSQADIPLAAFGDPAYAITNDTQLSDTRTRRIDWQRLTNLPATRREVDVLPNLFPGARIFRGEEATETALKHIAPQTRILHIAAHGYFDDRVPLDSGLLFSTPKTPAPGEDNGFLQVWEIFESLRTTADLVTLSACDTALAEENTGEGLLGLTRAFQFAGAHSVLASLWDVSDDSTATLMQHFYTALAAGADKNQALRTAQNTMLASAVKAGKDKARSVKVVDTATNDAVIDTSHPYYWAGFQLYGDWR